MACSAACKQGTVFSAGTLLFLGGILAGIFWSDVTDYIYKTELSLSKSSIQYDMWKETPIPMYLDLFFFNWTNPEATRLGLEKPRFEQVGPYTFSEKNTRVNVTWHPENYTVTFRQIREWHFDSAESAGGLDDLIVAPNVIAVTIASKMKDYSMVIRRIVNVLLSVKESFAIKRSVRELSFNGYHDPLLDIAAELKKVTNISIPFDKFGWFYSRNMSYTYDGIFNMFTGEDDLTKLGFLHTWNNYTQTPYFTGTCGLVEGVTGEVLPPISDGQLLPVFTSDLCSRLTLERSNDSVEMHGIEGVKFTGVKKEFDNGTEYPEYKCFSTKKTIMPSGVRDMSTCRYGAPAYTSFPHFYLADPWYVNSVEGLSPNKDEHEFYLNMEPSTGLPLSVKAQLQINILLEPVKGMKMFEKVPKVLLPVFFFRQRVTLTDDLASRVKLLLNLSNIGLYTFYGLAAIGGFVVALGVLITLRGYWSNDDETEMLINSTNNHNKPRSTHVEGGQ